MRNRNNRKISRQLLEGVIAIGLVLLFFFVIMSVLNLLFPSGSNFSLFMKKQEIEQVSTRIKREHDMQLLRNGSSDDLDVGEWAARLTAARNDVKSKRAVDIAWREAEPGMRLYNLDAVQTLDDSTALIHFDDQNEIDLGENSLIVIRRMEQDLIYKEKRSYMVVVDGELRGHIGGDSDDGVYLEVATPNAVTRLQSAPGTEQQVDFSINVDEDNASTITLYSGQAEVEAQGETVQLAPEQMTRILGQTAPSQPVALPKQVHLKQPADGARFAFRDLPPRVQLSWQPLDGPAGYHLQLARDRQFHDLVLDERLDATGFSHGNLAAGDYYWRVSGGDAEGQGTFSPVRHFRLVRDNEPPHLEVRYPQQPVTSRYLDLSGMSEPDSQVFVDGRKIDVGPDGLFNYRLPLTRGSNIIVVEAVDPAGNVSYSSERVQGVY